MSSLDDSVFGTGASTAGTPASSRGEGWIWFGLIVLTFSVYLQVWHFDFVNYDDGVYVFENQHVRAGISHESVHWAFTTTHTGNWIPLTWLSLMLDVEFYDEFAGGFHLTNVLIHCACTLLMFAMLHRMTKAAWKSALVAGLFAIHPLHVESVAWISERKDVLSTLFGIAALYGYVCAVEGQSRYWLVASIASFVCSLLSKQMLVTLPFVLILLDFWPLQRFKNETGRHWLRSLTREKLPYFIATFIFCIVAFWAQRDGGSVRSVDEFPVSMRIANSVVAYVAYMRKTVWPNDLAVLYPHPGDAIETTVVAASTMILLVVTAVVVFQRRQRPFLLMGWLWFLGTLVPVIGIVQIGSQQMADRYSYVPIIGLFIAVVWWAASIARTSRWQSWQRGVAVAALVGYAGTAWVQTGYWKNSVTLFQHTLAVTGDESFGFNYNLGLMLSEKKRFSEAEGHYRRAIELEPNDTRPVYNLGSLFSQLGETDEAISLFRRVIEINPDHAGAHNNLGIILHRKGQIDAAISHYQSAMRCEPRKARAYNNLALAYDEMNRMEEAETLFRKAINLEPEKAAYHNSLGVFLIGRKGNSKDAISCFREALRIDPSHRLAQGNLRHAIEQSRDD